jgi:hypothetical protein
MNCSNNNFCGILVISVQNWSHYHIIFFSWTTQRRSVLPPLSTLCIRVVKLFVEYPTDFVLLVAPELPESLEGELPQNICFSHQTTNPWKSFSENRTTTRDKLNQSFHIISSKQKHKLTFQMPFCKLARPGLQVRELKVRMLKQAIRNQNYRSCIRATKFIHLTYSKGQKKLTFCGKLVPGPDLEVLYLSPFVDKHLEEVASTSTTLEKLKG